MFVILWEYEVKLGCEESFERAHGSQGSWVQLFRRDPAYISTQLLRDPLRCSFYHTLDCWNTDQAFDNFKLSYRVDYESLDLATQSLTVQERLIGSFTRLRPPLL
jgi:hypothetical protein